MLFLLGFFYPLAAADIWQRVFSARSVPALKKAFPLTLLFLMLMTYTLVWIGMAAKPALLEAGITNDQAAFSIFSLKLLPDFALAYLAISFMAITMSTLDSNCYTFTSLLSKSLVPARVTNTRERYVRFNQALVVIVLASMSAVAMMITDVTVQAMLKTPAICGMSSSQETISLS